MPELPEVEVTRLSIAPSLQGSTVQRAVLGKPLRWPLGCRTADLADRVVGQITRRGKYLWVPLGPRPRSPARDAGGLLMHLGMSGSLQWVRADAPGPGPHDHFDLVTDRGTLRLHDPRRFGAVVWSASMDVDPAAKLLSRLGPEPFDPALDDATFFASLKARRSAIKQVLLSGDAVVGAGNIYACEALFVAGIDPRLPAHRVSRPRAARLLAAVRAILARALQVGGTTLRDFRDAHGMNGSFQHEAQVYGREGQPCRQCGSVIRRLVQAQRATYYCPVCQKR
jgi:formamidopyrimidine-DNA glycosylase